MKRNYTVTLEEDVWQRLEDLAREQGLVYQGRLSRSAVIERLVLGGPATAGAPAAAQSGPVQPAPVDAAAAQPAPVPAQPAAAAVPAPELPAPVDAAPAQPAPTQPAPVDADAAAAASAQPPYRLADIVARWPEKTREQWQQEEWKAGRWVKLVLDTING